MIPRRHRPHRLTAPVLVMALSVTPKLAAAEGSATTCPGTPVGATDMQALEACRQAARASEGRERARFNSTALTLGRKAYLAGRAGGRKWLEGDGHSFVHYGTKGCETAVDLEPVEATSTLDQCIGLLSIHIVDLTAASPTNASTAAELTKRREHLRELRAGLPSEPAPVAVTPPPAPAPQKKVQALPESDQRPPVPRGLYAGLGIGAGLTVLSGVTLGLSWSRGEHAQSKIYPPDTVDPQDAGKAVCDLSPQPSGCATLEQAKRFFITSAIGLGLGALTTAVFAGLLGHHRAQRRSKTPSAAFVVPSRSGLMSGFTLRF